MPNERTPTEVPGPDADAAPSSAEKPSVDLGPRWEAIAFSPGRYAAAVQRTLQGTHAAQRLREDSTASFVLELAADGSATACRGWRYSFFNDGPSVHTRERFREQQGYRGRYAVRDGVVEVDLGVDESVCAATRESDLALARSPSVKLRCVLASPRDQASLTAPALLCLWVDVTTGEPQAHLVPDLAPDGWMILGSGNGARIKITGRPPSAHAGAPTRVAIEPAPAPLGADAWEKPF